MRQLSKEEYKEVIVGILFQIDQICRANGLQYMLFYGTLLGAVRHKGMIPWDDDIDIVMPREDFRKLSEIINDGDYAVNFIDIEHSKDTIYPHGKICDKRTVLHEKNFKAVKGYGAFVDVFPLDYAPDDDKERMKQRRYLRKLVFLETHCARTGFERSSSLRTTISRTVAFGLSRLINPQYLLRKINAYVTKRDLSPTNYYRVLGGGIFPVEWLERTSEVEFEGKLLLAPENPDIVLRECFGDYMQLPPEEERVNKHSLQCYINESTRK